MQSDENTKIRVLIEMIRGRVVDPLEEIALAQTVLHETVGRNHPVMEVLDDALKSVDMRKHFPASHSVVTLYDEGMLPSPRLAIAHEIEGDILDVALERIQAAEKTSDETHEQLQLAIAAFLAGAALEDVLRRMCDAGNITYDSQKTSISTLQAELYQPSKGINVISKSENDYIVAWGKTRNNADHGRFSEITYAEVLSMVLGVRGFIDRHLP